MANSAGPDVRWQESLVEQLDRLGRWIQGRVVLAPAPADECVPAERYRDPNVLSKAIARARALDEGVPERRDRDPDLPRDGAACAGGLQADAPCSHNGISHEDDDDDVDLDLRIAMSRFTRHYASSLTITALVGLARGVGVDLAAQRCTMILRYNVPFILDLQAGALDVLRCRERTTPWPVTGPAVDTLGELRRYTWGRLYGENIGPLFELMTSMLGVSSKLLWANAAEWVGMVSDAAEEYLAPAEVWPFIAERQALLAAESLPGIAGPNPLRGQLEWVPVGGTGYPRAVQTRHRCCLTYMLPDRGGRLCQNCPYLSLEDRLALIRERHGVAISHHGGSPAERRAIEVGLAKMSHKA